MSNIQYAGRRILINIDVNNVGGASANWAPLPAQMDGGIDRKAKTVSTNNKQDNGWDSTLQVGRSWSVSCSGAIDPGDPIWQLLVDDWRQGRKRWIQIDRRDLGAPSEEGQADVDIKEKMGNEALWEFDATFSGSGTLVNSLIAP